MVAAAWLMEQGYEVFRNISHFGPIDVVAIKDRETLLIDVKMVTVKMSTRKSSFGDAITPKRQLTSSQREAGIVPLFVGPDGIVSFSLDKIKAAYDVGFKNVLTNLE